MFQRGIQLTETGARNDAILVVLGRTVATLKRARTWQRTTILR
jgi:hypothetical protein